MSDSPLFLALMIGVSAFLAKLWRDDYRAASAGTPNPQGMPGTTPAPTRALVIGAVGALLLLALETWGENALGISGEQTKMTVLFAVYTLLAPLTEEVIFRGYLVVTKHGKAALWAGAVGASLLFALLHPHLWVNDDQGFRLTLTVKGWFTTAILFVSSLWFYSCRFASFNPQRSLLPCIVAHAAKNAGVIAIKGVQGHLVGWW